MDEKIELLPFIKEDLNQAFSLYRKELYIPVDETFGWVEEFQQKRFSEQYQLEWFKWIIFKNVRIGYICLSARDQEIHVSLLVLQKEFQRQGFGKKMMKQIHLQASEQNFKITLSTFKRNESAIKFYKNLGYIVINQDEHFLDFSYFP